MSNKITNMVRPVQLTEANRFNVSPSNAKHVLRILADYADDKGVCWPSIATIAEEACLSQRQVKRALLCLEELGVIERKQRWNTSSLIKIITETKDTREQTKVTREQTSIPSDPLTTKIHQEPKTERAPRCDPTPTALPQESGATSASASVAQPEFSGSLVSKDQTLVSKDQPLVSDVLLSSNKPQLSPKTDNAPRLESGATSASASVAQPEFSGSSFGKPIYHPEHLHRLRETEAATADLQPMSMDEAKRAYEEYMKRYGYTTEHARGDAGVREEAGA